MSSDLPDWHAMTGEQRRQFIRPLWLDGKSAGEISLMILNVSRNAIIGTIHRMKLTRPEQSRTKPKPPPKVKMPPIRRIVLKPVRIHQDEDYTKQPTMDYITEFRPPLPGTTPIQLVDLPNRPGVACRFPVQGGYCGVDCGDDMYCADHYRFMYSAAPKGGPSTYREPTGHGMRTSR